MYTGLIILKPAKISENPLRIFSLKKYSLNSEKIFGIKAKDSRWYRANRPEDLIEIEIETDMLAQQQNAVLTTLVETTVELV